MKTKSFIKLFSLLLMKNEPITRLTLTKCFKGDDYNIKNFVVLRLCP